MIPKGRGMWKMQLRMLLSSLMAKTLMKWKQVNTFYI
jgi:hypothetical protein